MPTHCTGCPLSNIPTDVLNTAGTGNGTVPADEESNNYPPGDTATIPCALGFISSTGGSNITVKCGTAGTWTAVSAICNQSACAPACSGVHKCRGSVHGVVSQCGTCGCWIVHGRVNGVHSVFRPVCGHRRHWHAQLLHRVYFVGWP
jgi:hypothetical protein